MRRVALALALAALPASVSAQTARLSCIPKEEASALITFALPTLVERLAERCRSALPRSSYLSTDAASMAGRYRADADAAWPQARRAISRVFAQLLGQPMPAEMSGDMVRQLAEPTLATFLAEKVRTEDCANASEALQSLASVPGREVGKLAALGLVIADRKGNGIAGTLRICRPDERPS